MKKILISLLIIILSLPLYGQAERTSVEYLIFRLDYQSNDVKHIYALRQSVDMSSCTSKELQYHGLDVKIDPAGDFGGTTIRSLFTNQIVYEATTVWDGTGVHKFPTRDYEISYRDSFQLKSEPEFYDVVTYFFNADDKQLNKEAWETLRNKKLPYLFDSSKKYGVLSYLHYFSVGVNDPTTAEWIFILYTLPEDISPYYGYFWKDVTGNLPTTDRNINCLAPHHFFGDTVWIGTDYGAAVSYAGGDEWEPVEFYNNFKIGVTSLVTVANPYVDCLCSIVGLGTQEIITGPTDGGGTIFRSMIDGLDWEFTLSPNLTVTALAINPWNPYTMYAGMYDELNGIYSLFRLKRGTGWEKIALLSDETIKLSQINCIKIDVADTNYVIVGTDKGVYFTQNDTKTWTHKLWDFKISSVIINRIGGQRILYASTNGISKSDGIYLSKDSGAYWEVIHWQTNIVDLVQARNTMSMAPIDIWMFYMAVYNQGVFRSYNGCQNWHPINAGLHEKRITDLAIHPSKYNQLYLGTENGIFKYQRYTPLIDLAIANADLAYWPPEPKDGEMVEIYATVHNNSPNYVFNTEVYFYDNADGQLTVTVPIDTLTIPYILPNSDYTLRCEWFPEGQAGENIIFVEVDYNNKIKEIDENNNFATIKIELAEPPWDRIWVDISGNLPNSAINDIASHPFNRGELYAATNQGAYSGTLANYDSWEFLNYDGNRIEQITQIAAEMHPYLDWTVPVVWLSTEANDLTTNLKTSRIFVSADGGDYWRNSKYPGSSVSALNMPEYNSLLPVAAEYNSKTLKDSYYILLADSSWKSLDLTPGDTIANKINCFEFGRRTAVESYPADLYIGTEKGLYILSGQTGDYYRTLENLNVVTVIAPKGCRCKMIYAATSGNSYCDGVYKSVDNGQTWEKIYSAHFIVGLTASHYHSYDTHAAAPHLYLAIYNDGIYESRNGGYKWANINKNLTDLKFTCIAVDRRDHEIAYIGTESAIYYYDDPPTTFTEQTKVEIPEIFQVFPNYPNPFNNSTILSYNIPVNSEIHQTFIKIYNSLGQEVKSFEMKNLTSGTYKLLWDGTDKNGNIVNSGVYMARISNGGFSDNIKIVLLK